MGKKLLSAILMLLIFIPIFYMGGTIYNIFIYIIGFIAINEFISVKNTRKELPLFIKILCYIVYSFLVFSNIKSDSLIFSIDYRVLTGTFALFLIPTVLYHDRSKYSVNDAFYMIGGMLFLGISFSLMILVRNVNLNILIYLFLIGVVSDTYAFITGNLIGNKKLLQKVSPCKTVEGMIGGIVFGTFIPVSYYVIVINPSYNLFLITFITLFLCVLGVIGDLCFSAIKRYFEVKDFSEVIPGHGGILDRFDSIIFILLGFMFFISIIGG